MNMPDWLQLVGLIHDLGKIIYLRGCDEDGTSIKEQYSIVGDTYILGYPLPNTLVYSEFNHLSKGNEHLNLKSIYDKNCGLDNCYITYGHDEYLYNVLKQNNTNLPEEALYIIRFHSLYTWHTHNEYKELESTYDRAMKGWVKLFNQADLYSKVDKIYSQEEIEKLNEYYIPIINKYLPNKIYF